MQYLSAPGHFGSLLFPLLLLLLLLLTFLRLADVEDESLQLLVVLELPVYQNLEHGVTLLTLVELLVEVHERGQGLAGVVQLAGGKEREAVAGAVEFVFLELELGQNGVEIAVHRYVDILGELDREVLVDTLVDLEHLVLLGLDVLGLDCMATGHVGVSLEGHGGDVLQLDGQE